MGGYPNKLCFNIINFADQVNAPNWCSALSITFIILTGTDAIMDSQVSIINCDRACKNQPREHKLHLVIFLNQAHVAEGRARLVS